MKLLKAVLILSIVMIGCQQSEDNYSNNSLYSTLWVQTAAEYDALTLQVYNTAERMLPIALEDKEWTASIEQGGNFESLPPAVILDLDETAIDNSFYQARNILDETSFEYDTWNSWVREKQAGAIEGAVSFANKANEMGVAVFYITNRLAEVEAETIENLLELGFPVEEGRVMSNGGQPDWNYDKIERRKVVSNDYRVLMMVGKDLYDFVPAGDYSLEERRELVHKHADKWSVKWFILPNAVYGSWEHALYTGDEETGEDRQKRRLELLKDRRN